jgi:acyl carrier protein
MTEPEMATAAVDADLRARVVDRIVALLPRVLKRDVPDLSEATSLTDFNLSSTSMLELMLEIEDSLEIQVDVEDFDDPDGETIGALADYVARHASVFE